MTTLIFTLAASLVVSTPDTFGTPGGPYSDARVVADIAVFEFNSVTEEVGQLWAVVDFVPDERSGLSRRFLAAPQPIRRIGGHIEIQHNLVGKSDSDLLYYCWDYPIRLPRGRPAVRSYFGLSEMADLP